MHHIQRKILNKLLYAESIAYTKMRPEGVESNHFAYHLGQLIRAGLVMKKGKQYALSWDGLALVDRMSQEKMVDRLQPHILTVIDVTNDSGQTLLFKRGFQPYIHRLGFPLGKTHFGENVTDAAVRELHEKTGLTDIPLTQRGIAYIHITGQGHTISKVLCHVFQGVTKGCPATAPATKRGSCLWAHVAGYQKIQFMPGFLEVKALLQTTQPGLFFAELAAELE